MAARVHDSVLQTLALIQRSAAQPDRVVQLARTQERDLRSWLFEGPTARIHRRRWCRHPCCCARAGRPRGGSSTRSACGCRGSRRLPTRRRSANDAGRRPRSDSELRQMVGSLDGLDIRRGRGANKCPCSYGTGERDSTPMSWRRTARVSPRRSGQGWGRVGGAVIIRSIIGQGTEIELTVPRSGART